MKFDSIPRQFLAWGEKKPDAIAYAERVDGRWQATNWATYVDEVRLAARALIALGVEPGQAVGIMGFNCPPWTITDVAAMTCRGVPVGVYSTCATEQVAYILEHSGARVAMARTGDPLAKVLAARERSSELEHVVQLDGENAPEGVLTWSAFLERGHEVSEADLDQRLADLNPADLGALIYTSGTTGPPKGSMLTHGNLADATVMGGELVPEPLADDARLLSYLPMAHAAERSLTLLGAARYGYAVYYAESIEDMASNLREVQPDIFLGVPRVWEKIHAAIMGKIAEATGAKARIASWARRVGLAYHRAQAVGDPVGVKLGLEYKLASKLFFGRLRAVLGLTRAKVLLSGAAPIALDVLEDLASLDLPIREVYGQTEGSGPTSNNRPGETRWGSVGRPFRGVEVRIADDEEILLRGPNVFAGYYKDPEGTAQTLQDGWLHSGDLGYMDEDGYLYVTGRKKEIIITSGGKNITPRNIEEAIKTSPLVQEAVLIGDRRKFLSALVTVDESADLSPEDARARIWDHIEHVNRGLSSVERVKKIAVLPRPLSVEGGELTPTLKLRRSVISKIYSKQIEELYA